MARETRTITQHVYVPAAPLEVYNSLVDPERHAEVTGARARGQARVGGHFSAFNEYICGKYLALEPAKRILMEWETSRWPQGCPPSIVEITLKQKNSGTELQMVQSLLPVEELENCQECWDEFYWSAMKSWFRDKG